VRPPRAGLGLTSPDLNDIEWHAIAPLLPKARGIKRVDDRRVLNGILWRLRTGRSWASIPERYAPSGTCHARFIRWRDAGIWSRIVHAVSHARGGRIELIDAATACVPPSYQRTPIVANDVVAWRASA
jgi:transposase